MSTQPPMQKSLSLTPFCPSVNRASATTSPGTSPPAPAWPAPIGSARPWGRTRTCAWPSWWDASSCGRSQTCRLPWKKWSLLAASWGSWSLKTLSTSGRTLWNRKKERKQRLSCHGRTFKRTSSTTRRSWLRFCSEAHVSEDFYLFTWLPVLLPDFSFSSGC